MRDQEAQEHKILFHMDAYVNKQIEYISVMYMFKKTASVV
jgi:hypothetical protein